MATIKQRRITKIVREFVKTQDSYDITGVDLALSKFFYRASQELFQDLSTGDYRVDTSAGKQTLVITNQEILSAAEAFQVGYVLDFTATKYETQWNVDINTLKDRYNQLVDNTQELWEYIRKTGFISDDTTIDLILPQLDINEVWVRGENGYVGMPINDIQTSIKDAIQKYLLEVVYPTIDGYVEANSKPTLDEYVETTIKPEIDDFTDAKEVELQDLKDILANQLQELVDNALADRGVIPNGTDWNTLSYGTWYVSDLNGSNYTNHPNLEDTEGVGVVLVTDSQGGNAKVIRYYSMQKKMHFKIKNATGVWSEWSALSSGGGVRYEYTQANHGFLFTPVMLDGISGEWVRATTNGADGIAVYISRDRFELIMNGSVQIPNSAKDVNGDVFVNDEYYFLSNNVAGGLDREKPTGIFQPMIRTYLDEQGRMWAEVEVDTPVDLVPRVLNEEAESLGIQMEVDSRLQTEAKTVVGAINELNDRVGIENTIADLVASNRYVFGDVVEVLGFYTKGDGAHHMRIAKAEDDGSGELGQGGIWWCIVHNGEVNVSWFGAKGDEVNSLEHIFNSEKIKKVIFDMNCSIGTVEIDIDSSSLKSIEGTNTSVTVNAEFKFFSNAISNECVEISKITLDGENKLLRGVDYTNCKYIQGKPLSNVIIKNYSEACFESCPTIFMVFEDFKMLKSKFGIKQNRPSGAEWSTTTSINRCYITGMTNAGIQLDYQANLDLNNVICEYCGSDTSYERRGGLSFESCIRTQMSYCHLEANQRGIYSLDSPIMHFQTFQTANTEEDLIKWVNLSFSDRFNSEFRPGFSTIPNLTATNLTVKEILAPTGGIKLASKFTISETAEIGAYIHDNISGWLPSDAVANTFYLIHEMTYTELVMFEVRLGHTDKTRTNKHFVLKDGVLDKTDSDFKLELNTDTNKIEFWVKSPYPSSYGGEFFLNLSYTRSYLKKIPTVLLDAEALDTPYYATKMQQEGIYEDFISYMDAKLGYDKEQRYLEEQRQLAFESREDQEQTYEEWLATQPVLIPDNEPQPSEKLLEFKNKYIV